MVAHSRGILKTIVIQYSLSNLCSYIYEKYSCWWSCCGVRPRSYTKLEVGGGDNSNTKANQYIRKPLIPTHIWIGHILRTHFVCVWGVKYPFSFRNPYSFKLSAWPDPRLSRLYLQADLILALKSNVFFICISLFHFCKPPKCLVKIVIDKVFYNILYVIS